MECSNCLGKLPTSSAGMKRWITGIYQNKQEYWRLKPSFVNAIKISWLWSRLTQWCRTKKPVNIGSLFQIFEYTRYFTNGKLCLNWIKQIFFVKYEVWDNFLSLPLKTNSLLVFNSKKRFWQIKKKINENQFLKIKIVLTWCSG